jgi:FtsP/CotA-like multicopper oxidase with cupredoxin domain
MGMTRRPLQVILLALLTLALAAPVSAAVFFQCPGYDPATDGDYNDDGVLRSDAVDGIFGAEIKAPAGAGLPQVCVHLSSGDGFTYMADTADGERTSQYIFGFHKVTGIPDDDVMNPWDDAVPGGMLAAEFPAPTLTFREGDYVYLTLSNVGMAMRPDLFDPHTVHWHGFPNAATIFDGEPMASISVNMGASITYFYHVVEPGTFMYHCHVEATEHMQMGMLGNLYVSPAKGANFAYNDVDNSTAFDVDYPIQILAFDPVFHKQHIEVQPLPFAEMKDTFPMLNGRGYPDTVNPAPLINELGFDAQTMPALITATQGETILLRISSLSTTSFHTLATTGVPMTVIGKGSRIYRGGGVPSGADIRYATTSVTLGGGETIDVLLDTATVPAGTYFLYSTNLNHLSNDTEDYGGMMTEIVVVAP